jgi:L-fuculose-phosphate aldolase
MDKHLFHELRHISHSLFNKNFFTVFHGSISARIDNATFYINTKDTILDDVEKESFVKLDCNKKDYRWTMANSDAFIHELIYEAIPNAKYISYTMPPYATAFSLKHGKVSPKDYYGKTILGDMIIYDPQDIHDWIDRAPYEINQFFKSHNSHLMLIKGFGVICYDRDIVEMAKKVSILENSCKLLALSSYI